MDKAKEEIQYLTNYYTVQGTETKDIDGYCGPGWYFWEESGEKVYGPFTSRWWAEEGRRDYFSVA